MQSDWTLQYLYVYVVYSRFVYSHIVYYLTIYPILSHSHFHIPISFTGGIFTPMQPTQDHNGDINLCYIFCRENMAVRQSNQYRPRLHLRKFVWYYPAGVPVSHIIHSHLFCIESMAIRQIKQPRQRSDLRMYHY